MIDLETKVFGDIKAREIIGENPPAEPQTRKRLAIELEKLTKELSSKSKEELKYLLKHQEEMQKQMNSRPGAMALPQDKIKMFTMFSTKYMDQIKKILDS